MDQTCLLSDFDVVIDDSLLTSEPDICSANNIDQIAEIASIIGAKLVSSNQGEGINVGETEFLSMPPKEHNWCHNVYFSVDASVKSRKPNPQPLSPRGATRTKTKIPQASGRKKKNKVDGLSSETQQADKYPKTPRTQRSKQGCWTCRLRHKACPEDGNPCGACVRLGLGCDVSRHRPSYMIDAKQSMQRLKEIRAVTDKLRKSYRVCRRSKKTI